MFNISLKYKYYFLNLENINSGFMEQFLIISILQEKIIISCLTDHDIVFSFVFIWKKMKCSIWLMFKKSVSLYEPPCPFWDISLFIRKIVQKMYIFFSSLALNYARNPYFGMKLQNYVNLIHMLYMSYVYQWFAMIW